MVCCCRGSAEPKLLLTVPGWLCLPPYFRLRWTPGVSMIVICAFCVGSCCEKNLHADGGSRVVSPRGAPSLADRGGGLECGIVYTLRLLESGKYSWNAGSMCSRHVTRMSVVITVPSSLASATRGFLFGLGVALTGQRSQRPQPQPCLQPQRSASKIGSATVHVVVG